MTLHDWLETNYAKLRTYAIYRCRGDVTQAEDLLQEVLERALDGRLQVDVNRSPLTYFQLAMQSWQNRIRHGPTKVRQEADGKVWYQDQFVLIGDEWLVAQTQEPVEQEGFDFYAYFKRLPPRLQPVMELHLEGLSEREIALRLQRPHPTIHDQIRQGVARLKVLIHDANDGLDGLGRVGGDRLSSGETLPRRSRFASARRRGLAAPSE